MFFREYCISKKMERVGDFISLRNRFREFSELEKIDEGDILGPQDDYKVNRYKCITIASRELETSLSSADSAFVERGYDIALEVLAFLEDYNKKYGFLE